MNLEDSRIYKSLVEEPFHKVAKKVLRWTEEGRDVNFRDGRGRTYLHVVAEHADKFRDQRAVPVVYQLCLSGIDVDAVTTEGDTCLHMVVKREGTYRIVIALLRCGADPQVEDRAGLTAADIFSNQKPPGWEETLYWLNKFSPGLRHLVCCNKPDLSRIEQLLSYWCLPLVCKDGSTIDLIQELQEKQECDNDVINLLQRHMATNELAIATLAGSMRRVERSGSNEAADVNTRDASYQYHFTHSPEVAQPLLAAAWEQNNYDVIDALMTLKPDSSVLYSNHKDKHRKPLFFHVISGRPKPDSVSLIHRILRGSDLTKRNHKGQSVLYETIKHRLHVTVVKAIIQYGADVTSRDYKGRTARDYAESLGEREYVRIIDDHVINEINECNTDFVERAAMMAYDHITDVIQPENATNKKLCERLNDNRTYKVMAKCLQGLPRIERICRRAHLAVDECDVDAVRKYARGLISLSRNKCGQTLLHRAILSRDENIVCTVLDSFPHLINTTDNMDRTPLHYSNLILGGRDKISEMLLQADADTDVTDVVGRVAEEYRKDRLTTHEYSALLKDVLEFESSIILREMNFESGLNRAIVCGDLKKVKDLVKKAGTHAKMSAFSPVLFDCLDHRQPDIAVHLLKAGCDPDIWKQYEKCDPTEDACAMERCRHPVTSLHQRCKDLKYTDLAELVEQLRKEKLAAAGVNQGPNAFQVMANYGVAY